MDKKIKTPKDQNQKDITRFYKIGNKDKSGGLFVSQKLYKNRFKGKEESFTKKLEKETETYRTLINKRTDPPVYENKGPTIKVLKNIENRSTHIENAQFNDLYELLTKQDLLTLAHSEIQNNEGATTSGPTDQNIDGMSLKRIQRLIKKLKSNKFKWTGSRCIKIPRPGKSPRPLGIPDYDDKILQSAINIILNAIYNPEFKKRNTSFGFISHLGTHDNIRNLKNYSNCGLNIAIEGDIKGAFDNVDHKILMKILSKKIKDKKFLKLIYESCKAGKLEKIKGKYIFNPINNLGTPQGSIVSPTLFNIYMNEFDKFILEDINNLVEEINTTQNRQNKATHPKFLKYKSIIDACKKGIKKLLEINTYCNLTTEQRTKLYDYKKRILKMKKRRFKVPSIDKQHCTIRIYYNRYADDFIILTNSEIEIAELIKTKITEYLGEQLKLKLSAEKTLITDIEKKPAKFLGFNIYISNKIQTKGIKETLQRNPKNIKIGIDMERRKNGLITKKFMYKTGIPRETPYLLQHEPHQIIELYNSIIDGIVNAYYPMITCKSELNFIIYILHYSCLKTLATKFKTTINKLLLEYGWPEYNIKGQLTGRVRLIWKYNKLNQNSQETSKYCILRNYTDAMDMGKWVTIDMAIEKKTYSQTEIFDDDYKTMFKLNWRTKFKYESCCTICGNTENLESHHIRKIGGLKAKKTELKILQKLNRKQITICRTCHNNIHNGKYDGKSLNSLAEIRVFRIGQYMRPEPNITDIKKLIRNGTMYINDKNRKYFPKAIQKIKEDINKVSSSPIKLDLINTRVINYKERAQKIVKQSKSSQETLKKILNK